MEVSSVQVTMLVTGAMIMAGAWFAYLALRRKAVLIPTALLGVGTLGVGVFPLTHPTPHTLFASPRSWLAVSPSSCRPV